MIEIVIAYTPLIVLPPLFVGVLVYAVLLVARSLDDWK